MTSPVVEIASTGGFYQSAPQGKLLVVMLHAYRQTPATLGRVAGEVRRVYPESDILAPRLPFHLTSLADPNDIAQMVVDAIDEVFVARYKAIMFIGHSMGAIIARRVWALAHGMTTTTEIDPAAAKPWATSIKRIVLTAALNRGWRTSTALDPVNRLIWAFGTAWGNFMRYNPIHKAEPVIMAFRQGAPFLTLTRLQCLELEARLGSAQPIVVQLLGTSDDYVAPTDNVDLATGANFFYLEVPGATHRGIVDLDEGFAGIAAAKFRRAIAGNKQHLTKGALKLEEVFDLHSGTIDDYDVANPNSPSATVTDVVFVIHGIRDRGFWTHRLARAIKSYAREHDRECRTVTSTYGYFAMGPFLLPWVRRSKAEWLLDQIVSARSLYPRARFSYVGHSNGTYLLAKALHLCPAVRFEQVVFAGSVVRTDWDWQHFIGVKQVKAVLNYVATGDWVVAVFPSGLQRGLGADVGGAGHLGFQPPPLPSSVSNLEYVKGSHGAALAFPYWREMAAFVIDGKAPGAPTQPPPRGPITEALGRAAPFICWLLIAFVFLAPLYLLWSLAVVGLPWLLGLILYCVAMWALLTRF